MTEREALAIFDEMAVRYFKAHRWKELDAIYAAQDALLAQQQAEDNDPLTLEELRNIKSEDGEPLYLTGYGWRICYGTTTVFGGEKMMTGHGALIGLLDYGKRFAAYRRKPEEGTA